jgi:serine/threonine-protein kinase
MSASETGTAAPNATAEGAAEASWTGRCVDGRYQIEQQLGSGGVGKVYRARPLALDRCVAPKVLRKQHNERWISRKRFEREARALARLAHPHVVAVADCGVDADAPFLMMELLDGESLASRLRRGPLAPADAVRRERPRRASAA